MMLVHLCVLRVSSETGAFWFCREEESRKRAGGGEAADVPSAGTLCLDVSQEQ
jgi:hypothetical protein